LINGYGDSENWDSVPQKIRRYFDMKRKGGFTLVELLIVIMIIGILAGMVLLSMGPVLDSVRASNIISDTRTVLSAAHMFLVEEMETPKAANQARVIQLMNKNLVDNKKYSGLAFVTEGESEYVGLVLAADYNTTSIKKSLEKKAVDVGGVAANVSDGTASSVVKPNAATQTAFADQNAFLLPMRQTTPTTP